MGKVGDGGIDGIIHQDKLGLDVVYIQAKRYAPDNTVGRPELQAFVGTLAGVSANLRTSMIHGARAVLGKAGGKTDARNLWIGRMRNQRHTNVVAVALANMNARIVWSILSGGTE